MVCPRCSTKVSPDALYCSYCSLPKPKAGFGFDEQSDANPSRPPASSQATSRRESKPSSGRIDKTRPKRRIRVAVVALAGLVAALSTCAYIFVIAPLVHSQGVEPKLALSALDRLQHMPSNDPELSVDARLSNELENSRRVGNLVGYQGWTVHPVRGTKTRVLLVFSFHEVGNREQRAEWLADLNANTFTPQTALAVSISK